ncbi:MAG: hypothetical protein U0796_00140 [Gemmatales bacterium]
MSIQSVAVLFDNTDRPETTGVYVRRALGELVQVDHYLPNALQELRNAPYDFYLQVDDGHDVVLPEQLRPIAFWAIDTHMDLERYRRIAHRYDWIFTAQRDGAEALQKMGIQANWLQ